MEVRSQKGVAWCWQDKAVTRKIREEFDETGNIGTALAIYQVLTEIASNNQADVFEARHSEIARMSGFSTRTVIRVLNVFKSVKIIFKEIQISETGSQLPARYTLIGGGDIMSPRGDMGCRPVSGRIEESIEESIRNISIEEKFNLFWEAYPRKVGKKLTKDIFTQLNPDRELLDHMLTSLKHQYSVDVDTTFVKHPKNWLLEERWEDEESFQTNGLQELTWEQMAKICATKNLDMEEDFKEIKEGVFLQC